MLEQQTSLPLETPAPKVTPEQVERVVGVLKAAGHGLTAREICAALGEGEASDRWVRSVAAACAPRIVSFPGSKGYTLWEHCTVEEILHAIEAFESQGKDMFRRALLYRRAYHAKFRGGRAAEVAAELRFGT